MKFTKKSRLADDKAISHVFQQPDWKVQDTSGLILVRKNELGFPRLVVIVGKKKIKRAIDRNRIRRVVRASFQRWFLPTAVGVNAADFVFVARQPALKTAWLSGESCSITALWTKASQRLSSKKPSEQRRHMR